MELPPVIGSLLTAEAKQILLDRGIACLEDFVCMYQRPEELFQLSADPGTLDSLTRAWQIAHVQMKAAEEKALAAPGSGCKTQSRKRLATTLPSILGARPKARMFAPATLQPRSFRQAMGGMNMPSPHIQGAKPDKRLTLLQVLFEAAVLCASQNTAFGQELVLQQEEAKPSFFRKFQTTTTDRLSSLCSSMKRWVAWHSRFAPGDQPFWKPSPVTLSQFFSFVSRGGPTAASGVFQALKWWAEQVGLPLPLRHAIVSHWAVPEQGHTASPRLPLPLRIMLDLCSTANKTTGSVRSFVAAALLVLCACLRFRHLQRSQDLRLDSGFLRGKCSMGKRRVQQTRPPFEWAAPSILSFGFDMALQVLLDYEELCRAYGSQPGFVLQDFEVAAGACLRSDSKRSLRELSLGRFIHLLRALLLSLGVPDMEVCKFTSYSLRRFLPTAADVLLLPEEMRLAIGGWQEQPKTASSQPQPRAKHTMAQRYADDKVLTSGQVKKEVVVAIDMTCRRLTGDMTWDDLRQNAPSPDELTNELKHSRWQPPSFKATCVAQAARSGSDSSCSSSSSSDSELDAADADLISWFQQTPKGALHLVQGMLGSRLVPFCQDLPFDALHAARGAGLEGHEKLCLKCRARAPKRIQDSLPGI